MKWNNIKDTLPHDSERVLVWNGNLNQPEILTYNDHYKCWDDSEGDDFYCHLSEAPEWISIPTRD